MRPYNKPAYRPDVDGLRAIAVLSVVFYHAGVPGFSGGFVGVDVFFVISGFLITQIVWSELQGERFSLTGFYLRRVRRIFPALFTVLTLTSMAALVLLVPRDLMLFGKSLNATVLFYSNFHWLGHLNYFDGPAIEKPLLHVWSLAVEEQFYAAWPLLLLLTARFAPANRVRHVVLALALVSFILAEARLLTGHQKDAFFLPWCRAWELFLGALLAVSSLRLREGPLTNSLSAAGLSAIFLAVLLYDTATSFPGHGALLPCMGAALIIATGSASNPVARFLSSEPIRHIGLISYSLYLIHWPLFSFVHLYLNQQQLSLELALSLALLSIFLAHVSWRFIEMPWRAGQPSKRAVFGGAATAMIVMYLAGAIFYDSRGLPFRASEQVLAAQPVQNGQDTSPYCRKLDIPELRDGDACLLGEDQGGAFDFILWGDSHARHYAPAVSTLATSRKLSGVLIAKDGCPPFLEDPSYPKACLALNNRVARWAAEVHVKLAILGGRWRTRLGVIKRFLDDGSPGKNVGGLAKTLAFLTGDGIQVSVLDQTPEFSHDVQLCVARALFYGRDTGPCVTEPASLLLSWHNELDDYFEFLRREYSFSVASGVAAICDGEFCRASKENVLLMMDGNHLSWAGSLKVMPYLRIPLLNSRPSAAPGTESPAAKSRPPSTAVPR
jgi:peptidoglycan/LPS O-acetylase OafA/YrhL